MPKTLRVNGSRIRSARLAAGMTQAQLARTIVTTERNIIRWENGQNQPRVESVAAIAEATSKDVSYFLNDDEDDEESDALPSLDQALRSYLRKVIREEARVS